MKHTLDISRCHFSRIQSLRTGSAQNAAARK